MAHTIGVSLSLINELGFNIIPSSSVCKHLLFVVSAFAIILHTAAPSPYSNSHSSCELGASGLYVALIVILEENSFSVILSAKVTLSSNHSLK